MKKVLFTIIACLAVMTASAEDAVTVSYESMTSGKAGTITVNVKADKNIYSAYNFYMYVPKGMTFESKAKNVLSDGDVITDDNDMSYAWGAKDGSLGTLEGYDCYLVTGYDGTNECFDAVAGGSLVNIAYTGGTFTPRKIILDTVTLTGPNSVKKVIARVDGPDPTATAIETISANSFQADGKRYNVAGQQVNTSAKGLIIQGGKKVVK